MKSYKLVLLIASLGLFLSACASEVIRVSSNLRAVEYNNISSQYMERPTFVAVEKLSGPDDRMRVEVDTYSSSATWVYFIREYVDEYIPLIDKYLKWEKIASSKGDQINKVIGTAGLWAGASMQFSFYSGNAQRHYLVIEPCGLGLCSGETQLYVDKRNAEILKGLLIKFKKNEIHQNDTSAYQ